MNIIEKFKSSVDISEFTKDQAVAYDELIKFINDDFNINDYKRALVGPAGTGKTYLVKALIKNSNINYSQIGLSAPTHKACRVLSESIGIREVKVNTLQSDLGLRVNFDVEKFDIKNPPFDPQGKIKMDSYKIYIIDEASMINRGLLMFLERICKQSSCKIIFIGDASQLPPVNEKYSPALRNIKTCTLRQIVRQEKDNPIKPLLELLRYDIDHKTYKFLNYISKNHMSFDEGNTKGFEVCNSQKFEEMVKLNFNDGNVLKNVDYAKVIAYTNLCVSNWNKFIRHNIVEDCKKSIINKNDLIISYNTIVDNFNAINIANSEEYILQDIVNYTHPSYDLTGFLVRFIAIHGGKVSTPLFILDYSNKYNVLKYMQISNGLINDAKTASPRLRAKKWKDYYNFKDSCLLLTNIINSQGEIIYSRDLDYGFALTSHRSQGSTFDTVLVDVNDIVFNKYGQLYTDAEDINRRLYVACSRCKNKLYLKFGK